MFLAGEVEAEVEIEVEIEAGGKGTDGRAGEAWRAREQAKGAGCCTWQGFACRRSRLLEAAGSAGASCWAPFSSHRSWTTAVIPSGVGACGLVARHS